MSSNLKRDYRSAVTVELLVKNTKDTMLDYTVVFRLKQGVGKSKFLAQIENLAENQIVFHFGKNEILLELKIENA